MLAFTHLLIYFSCPAFFWCWAPQGLLHTHSARSLLPSHAPSSQWRECTEGRGPFSFCFSHPDHPTPTSGLLPTCSGLTHPPSSFSCPLTCETRRAEAEECSGEIKAAGSHWAGVTQTFIDFCLAVWPFKACGRRVGQGSHRWSPLLATEPQFTWETLAVEGSRLVSAAPPIGTGGAATLVHVFLTSGASESWWERGWDGKGGCSRTCREARVNKGGSSEETLGVWATQG